MNNHQGFTSPPLGNFLNPTLALLEQNSRNLLSKGKLNFSNYSHLCKSLEANYV
ncbi:hypothetical protein [uncultured Gammaproteobacteria bacterium]|nr:hypothetical protein [uncultured Gammaproteobacteria bacterium]CAC9553055.1 hypothetical protein [uncultured Gammaproteobacteria bacterium]CAC9578627.1 hypothetical protein [uncultured Gammaproteobacteria bacterium]CAC9609280.1 hypothetical protein [uncultured Gammaproteobacteria bacterium]CAC9641971.1 hypothetical protein [uncultured Gammaproteobacteria bacterium]